MSHQTIVVLDFGSQYTQLIARRLRELNVYSEIVPFDTPAARLAERQPAGVILSGGPRSVSEPGAPRCDAAVFDLPVPILGICYGMQLMADALGGVVAPAPQREYGHATIAVQLASPLFADLPHSLRVWASHGDLVQAAPPGYTVVATSANAPVAAMQHEARRRYALLFHPEVAHTEHGTEILRRFAYGVCGCRGDWTMASFVEETVASIRARVGEGRVLCGLSGGVDSTVAAVLVHRAIGDRLTCVFVDNGVLRQDEAAQVRRRFVERLQLPVVFADASSLFLDRLAGVTDPERKRKIIGATFIEVFEARAAELGQGSSSWRRARSIPTSSRACRSSGRRRPSRATTTSAACPSTCGFSLVEPLRALFKDEVRRVGLELGLDEDFVWRQPFPGPGLAVRILGEVTADRLRLLRQADAIVAEEIRRHGWYRRVWQSFAVLLPVQSVGVMGDERTYEYTIALRAVESRDGMTADWARLPHDLLAVISSRIMNEVKGVNRVVYDISSKPPATIEWE